MVVIVQILVIFILIFIEESGIIDYSLTNIMLSVGIVFLLGNQLTLIRYFEGLDDTNKKYNTAIHKRLTEIMNKLKKFGR